MAQSFRDLKVWQEGMLLAKDIYLMTNEFPKSELYGLTSQMRRCSVSVPANIAEGSGRGSKKDFVQFLHIAQGSLRELETYLLLCEEIGLMTSIAISPLLTQVETVGKMLLGLLRSLETSKTSN
jgi:four helix bundle protein